MKKLIALTFLFLVACGGGDTVTKNAQAAAAKQPTINATWTGYYSSWWEIPQYYSGIPKYSGAFGTYTHKHIPMAVKANGELFHIRTDNTQDDNFYVYAMKGVDGNSGSYAKSSSGSANSVVVYQESKKKDKLSSFYFGFSADGDVHDIPNWDDPHTNAVINVDNDGYVWVHIASRGLNHKFQSGKILKSKTPYELDFECVDGCTNTNYEAYPQVHNTSWGIHKLYTHYKFVDGKNIREPWSVVNGNRQKLSNDAAYQISHYADGELCTARNRLVGGKPDDRRDVYFLCTTDGSSWYDQYGDPVSVPLDFDDYNWDAQIFDSMDNGALDDKEFYVYLKDMYKYNGVWRVLFVKSDSPDPTQGQRWLVEWVEGDNQWFPREITEISHNYAAGAYLERNGELYITTTKYGPDYYLSGDVVLFDTNYNEVDHLNDGGGYSYIRRVRNGNGEAVLSRGAADLQQRGQHCHLNIE